ncbi:terminase large subunit [Caulobacter sp. DWR3-1-2]|uniref:terminase large subunit n=1 Tax=Caulobacter sp. DWR3-1-2 TaxID=2804647 RepID=UPI003CEDE01A
MAVPRGEASAAAMATAHPEGLHPLPEWLRAIEDDETYQWAVLAWHRAAAVPGAWFDHQLADGIVAEWATWATLTTDRFAGIEFKLLPWQEIIVRLLVGWMAPTEVLDPRTHKPTVEHVRIFRRLVLWVPRKNGKTEFLAALTLLFFTLDGLVGGEGYVFARDEGQARIVFDKMKTMIANSDDLKSQAISYKKSIWFKELRAAINLLSGAEDGKHGKGPTVIVGDEIHEWKSLEISNHLRQGTGGRLQPIELYASTTGKKSNKVGMQVWEESRAILEGRISDPATLVVIFAAPANADFRDEKVWRLANPSLGLSPTLQYLRREAALAVDNPRQEAYFRCFHLNQWIDAHVRWLNLNKWDACTDDALSWKTDAERLRGRRCWGAFDISSTKDVTALVWLFEPTEEDPKWRLVSRFWVPADTMAERVKNDRVDYDKYVAEGAMETTPGDFVDQNYVLRAVLEGLEMFEVLGLGYDPWNATKLISDLQDPGGVDPALLIKMRQGVQTLGEPSKHFERLVYSGQLDHGGHPVQRWMAGNAVVRFDENLNFMPAKKKSSEKIDGIVADVMVVGLAFANETTAPSVYEERGLLLV